MKKQLIASLVSLICAAGAHANADLTSQDTNKANHENFRGASHIVANQENWYRELRLEDWNKMGVTTADVDAVLEHINGGLTLRDQSNDNKAGYWTYEFSKQAQHHFDLANKGTDAATNYRKASTLWMIASYPNLHTDHELAALDKSVDAYVLAATASGEKVERVEFPLADGGSATGLLHLPKDKSDNLAAVLWTGGVDKSLVEHKKSIDQVVERGFAVLSFDMPGAGLNRNNVMSVGTETLTHDGALAFIKADKRINSDRIGALSSSGAGIPLMEFAIKQPELKAVVARCTVVDGLLTKPFLFPELPLMTSQSFGTRVGADINDLESFGQFTVPLSLKTKGYFDGKTRMDTPLLVINTSDDMVSSPEDMKKTAALSSQGKVEFYGDEGHCPEGKAAEEAITQFLTSNI
ncbi:alpha/beta hydrolase [Vibrio aquaticus]|nr:alpha/beta hydrolase [Vibrio aquaticus]